MRKAFILSLTSLALMSMAILPTPAAATDKDQALKLCGQNRNCAIIGGGGKDTGVDLSITQSDGRVDIVTCNAKGPCSCLTCKPTGGGKSTPTSVVAGALKASGPGMAKTPTTPKKIEASGDVKKTNDTGAGKTKKQ
jgi:hypothetical protein